jgi:hypothetical protein
MTVPPLAASGQWSVTSSSGTRNEGTGAVGAL